MNDKTLRKQRTQQGRRFRFCRNEEAEFLAALEKTPRTWRVVDGDIRNADGCCPLGSVDPMKLDVDDFKQSASNIGLDELAALRIASAADMCPLSEYDRELRSRILRACGLEGE